MMLRRYSSFHGGRPSPPHLAEESNNFCQEASRGMACEKALMHESALQGWR